MLRRVLFIVLFLFTLSSLFVTSASKPLWAQGSEEAAADTSLADAIAASERETAESEDAASTEDPPEERKAEEDKKTDSKEKGAGEKKTKSKRSKRTTGWNDQYDVNRYGPIFSWPKLLLVLLIILPWFKTTDWVNRSSQIHDLGYTQWNLTVMLPVLAGLVACVMLPTFVVTYSLLAVAYLVTLIAYIVVHNKNVGLHQKVLTSDWFRHEVAAGMSKVGIKVDASRKADYEKGAAVDLMAMGGPDDRTNHANLITARQSPGYLLAKDLVVEMVTRHADKCMLDYTSQGVSLRNLIDGVWHSGEPRDRESGDVLLAVVKTLANLDMNERKRKQSGVFGAHYGENSFLYAITSQGVQTGERVILELQGTEKRILKTYEELGLREKLASQWLDVMAQEEGLVLISAMPSGGLTTLTDVALLETDRLMRDFVAVEEVSLREREIENIEVTTYDRSKKETAAAVLPAMIRKYPNVYVVRDFSDPATAKLLLDQTDGQLVVTTVQAKSSAEAMLRILQKKTPVKEFAQVISAVINVRLIRKLCEECKVSYEPTSDLLKKLGIPAGRVEHLYRVPKGEEIEKVCEACSGIGYQGRTGIFELLQVNDQIREILVKQPKLGLLQKAARLGGMRTLQEEGVLLIARGTTSLDELMRVLKL